MRKLWARIGPAAGYLLLTFPTALATMVMFPLLAAVVMTTAAGGAGLLLMPRAIAGIHRWADWHRWRAASCSASRSSRGARSAGRRGCPAAAAARRSVDLARPALDVGPGRNRHPTRHSHRFCVAAPILTFLVLPFWWLFPVDAPFDVFGIEVHGWGSALLAGVAQLAPAAVLAYWCCRRWRAGTPGSAWRSRAVRREQLAERVDVLTETRTNVIDAHGAELRRIERDLHDSTRLGWWRSPCSWGWLGTPSPKTLKPS